jgi:Flp pilus assembly protein TadG
MTTLGQQPNRKRRFRSNDTGAAGVEFALVIPVLLIGLFLTIEFARVMYSKIEFEYAVFSATRFSSVGKIADTVKVQQALSDNLVLLNPTHLSPIGYSVVQNADNTQTATLTASYRVDSLLPLTEMTSITLTRSISYLISQ